MESPGAYTLTELADIASIPVRTLRYYLAQGLLPAPVRQGRHTRYPGTTLRRLRLIKRLRAANQPLADIRDRLETMSDDDVAAALAPRGMAEQMALRAGTAFPSVIVVAPPVAAEAAWPAFARMAAEHPATMERSAPERPAGSRSQWERIFLEPGVELHVQRPLSRLAARRVDRLVAVARELLENDLEDAAE
jgi:DNA-binding transcriptional MerR regulator